MTYFEWQKDPKAIAQLVRKRLLKKSVSALASDPAAISSMSKQELVEVISKFRHYEMEDPEFYYRLGLHFFFLNLGQQDLEQAQHNFHQATLLKPDFHEAYYFYARSFLEGSSGSIRFHQVKEPVEKLVRALQLSPGDQTYLQLAHQFEHKFYFKNGLRSPFQSIKA